MTDLQRLVAAMKAAGCEMPERLSVAENGEAKYASLYEWDEPILITMDQADAIAMILGDEEVARWLSKRQHYIQPKRNHGELWEMLEPAPHERQTWKRTLFSTKCAAYTAAFEHIAGRRADA